MSAPAAEPDRVHRRRWATVVAVGLLLVVAPSCSYTGYDDLEMGQCLPSGAGVEGVRVAEPDIVPCSHPHLYEVYARGRLEPPTRAWPGQDELDVNAERVCALQVPDATGREIVDLPEGVRSVQVAPGREAWDAGERAVECLFRYPRTTTDTLVVDR